MRNLPHIWVQVYRVLRLLAACLLFVGQSTGADAASPTGKVVIKFSHNQQTITPPHKAAEVFKQMVEHRTNSYYDVQIFPAQQLGGLRDQVEQTILGTIEVTQQTPAIISLFAPKVMILDFPFLWPNDEAAMWKVLDGPLGQELLKSLEAKGLKGADFWSSGFKNFTTSKKPIRSPEDFQGMKMRVIPSPLLSAQYEAWGASPTPVDFKELYTALQQGLVDGQENPPGTIVDTKLYEVQKYMTESRHGFLYRETPIRRLPHLCLESGIVSAVSVWLIAGASVFTWLLAREQVPQLVAGAILTISQQPWFFLVASVVIFTGFAALLEGFPAVIILGPIFYPIAVQMGLSTLHFSIIIVACVGIGLFLPPVGVGLFIACGIARVTMTRVIGTFGPYLVVLLVGLLLIAFIPWITLVLPAQLLGLK